MPIRRTRSTTCCAGAAGAVANAAKADRENEAATTVHWITSSAQQ